MDNDTLAPVLRDTHATFWMKSQGIPGVPVAPDEVYGGLRYFVGFSVPPLAIRSGDVLIVYRIGVSMIEYVGGVEGSVRRATRDEVAHEPWREQWPWGIDVRNLTPEFGRAWIRFEMKPFQLVKAYNRAYRQDKQSLGALQFGKGSVRISAGFAHYILDKISQL